MKAKCQVSFEYELRPPDTWKGDINGNTPQAIMRRAVHSANKKLHPRMWTSMVAVITERTGVELSSEIEIPQKFAPVKKVSKRR